MWCVTFGEICANVCICKKLWYWLYAECFETVINDMELFCWVSLYFQFKMCIAWALCQSCTGIESNVVTYMLWVCLHDYTADLLKKCSSSVGCCNSFLWDLMKGFKANCISNLHSLPMFCLNKSIPVISLYIWVYLNHMTYPHFAWIAQYHWYSWTVDSKWTCIPRSMYF